MGWSCSSSSSSSSSDCCSSSSSSSSSCGWSSSRKYKSKKSKKDKKIKKEKKPKKDKKSKDKKSKKDKYPPSDKPPNNPYTSGYPGHQAHDGGDHHPPHGDGYGTPNYHQGSDYGVGGLNLQPGAQHSYGQGYGSAHTQPSYGGGHQQTYNSDAGGFASAYYGAFGGSSNKPQAAASSGGGRKKGLMIGINYRGQRHELGGCVNDANDLHDMLTSQFRFDETKVLTDDTPDKPTKRNIIHAMEWLIDGARPGDVLWFSYSGHGTRVPDRDGDERDGYDEALCPVDVARGNVILDDEVREIFNRVPEGVNLTCWFDCCHSGNMLDHDEGMQWRDGGATRGFDGGYGGGSNEEKPRFLQLYDDHELSMYAAPNGQLQGQYYLDDYGALDMSQPRTRGAPSNRNGLGGLLFAAVKCSQQALDIGHHGLYTQALLNVGRRQDLKSLSDLDVHRAVKEKASRRVQTPILECDPKYCDVRSHKFLSSV